MKVDYIREYCLRKPGVTEDLPFDENTLVMKVGSKMFALFGNENPLRINLKCDPILAEGLRRKYEAVIPGYHMNKKHWNTVIIDDSIPENEILGMIDHSYKLVLKNLQKSEKEEITNK